MKHRKFFGIFVALIAVMGMIALVGCSSGSAGSPPQDNPATGVMSYNTANEIFVLAPASGGGHEIRGFKSTDLLVSWLLREKAAADRAAFQVGIPETFTIPKINNVQVTVIADRAFSPNVAGNEDISTVVNKIILPNEIRKLGTNVFENIANRITLVVPPAATDNMGGLDKAKEFVESATAGSLVIASVEGSDGDTVTVTPDADSLDLFSLPSSSTTYTLSYFEAIDETAQAKAMLHEGTSAKMYRINNSSLYNLFKAIYTPNKPGSSDSVETGKTAIAYTDEISTSALGLFKITIGSGGAEQVDLKGTTLPAAPGASATNLIVIDIGIPGETNSLPTFYIPKDKNDSLGNKDVTGDYSHIRLRVNNGAKLVIVAENSGYINTGVGNPCPAGNFKGGCVEVMEGGYLRDGAYEGFPLGEGAVILNRYGSFLSVGPEADSDDAIGAAKPAYDAYYSGYLLGTGGRVEWDADNDAMSYLEVRSKKIATDAKLTLKKSMGLIYSVWFLGDARLTISGNIDPFQGGTPGTGGLYANEKNGGDDYSFYAAEAKAGRISIESGSVLDGRFLDRQAKDLNPSSFIAGPITVDDIDGSRPESYTETISGYLLKQ
jgi:hypothetical protein